MKKTSLKLLSILMLVFFATLQSCDKDEPNTPNTPPPDDETYVYDKGAAKTADFMGQIVDENGNAMSGVAVSIGSQSVATDANGVFFINNANVYKNLAFVKAEKAGYFLGSRSLVPTNGVNNVKIMMLQKQQIGSFDAATGGSVSGNGITINFQDGVVDANGNAYTGNVNVAAKYIDPESDNFADYMPGNLIAADADGNRYLESYGMVAVELTDGSGNELQPAEGKDATVSFPLSSGLLADAPSTIALWHFSETGGYWVYEGTATLEGGVYKAQVSHFSFWNCDIPTDNAILDGQLVDANNTGLSNVRVRVVSANFGSRSDFTSSTGHFGGIVPANDNLTLEIFLDCGGGEVLIHTENVGAISSNTTLSPIVINSTGISVNVSGTLVDCNYGAVGNGYVIDNSGRVCVVSSGAFNFVSCANTSIGLKGFDLDNFNESGVNNYTLGISDLNVGQLVACNSISEYIQWNIDGTDYVATGTVNLSSQGTYGEIFGSTPDNINVSIYPFNGVGTYIIDGSNQSYLWGSAPLDSIVNSNITVDITQYGANSGDLVEGTINGTFDQGGSSSTISGTIHFFVD
ncbi:MAG: hypothetical protein R2836_10795 [Chitinophagales bacterium]